MNDEHASLDHELPIEGEPNLSIAHFLNILGARKATIYTILVATAILYAIAAILLYLVSPAQRAISQPFQLTFESASKGRYPNGLPFSPVEIVSSPILLKVYQRNEVNRFLSFNAFSRSLFVLESNPAYDALAREYEARLSDAKLSTVDRERIQKEFELKREAIKKNEFSINFQRSSISSRVPESTARTVLVDTLNVWADDAVNHQHALDYRVAVLSPNIVDSSLPQGDYVAHILMLRSQIAQVIVNLRQLYDLPGAEMIKTPGDRLSLSEIEIRLDSLIRFQLEPLMTMVTTKHLIANSVDAQRFVQDQLAYDERQLDSLKAHADGYRAALAVYAQRPENETATPASTEKPRSDTVMPQLNDSFLDRLVDLTARSSDVTYRQNLADEYRKATEATIPYAAAVAYDKQILDQLKNATGGGTPADAAQFQASIGEIRAEVRRLIGKTNEIYTIESANLRPASQLFTLSAPPATRVERSRSLTTLALFGIAVILIALVVAVIVILAQDSMRQDEDARAEIQSA